MGGQDDLAKAIEDLRCEIAELNGKLGEHHLSEADKTAIRDIVRPPAPTVDPAFAERFALIRGPLIPGSSNATIAPVTKSPTK